MCSPPGKPTRRRKRQSGQTLVLSIATGHAPKGSQLNKSRARHYETNNVDFCQLSPCVRVCTCFGRCGKTKAAARTAHGCDQRGRGRGPAEKEGEKINPKSQDKPQQKRGGAKTTSDQSGGVMLLVVVFTLNTALVSSLPSTFFCLNISVPRCGLVHQDSLFLAFRRRLMRAMGLRLRPRDILRRARACTSSMNSCEDAADKRRTTSIS